MKEYCLLYKGKASFEEYIANVGLNYEKEYFVCIHTSAQEESEAVKVAKNVKSVLPHAKIIGTSVEYIIYHGKIIGNECLIMIFSMESTGSIVEMIPYKGLSPQELSDKVDEVISRYPVKTMFTFFSEHYNDTHSFLDFFNVKHSDIHLVGGLACNIGQINGYLFNDTGVIPKALAIGAFYGEDLQCYSDIITGHEALGDVYTVTKSDGEYVDEVDGHPIVDWLREYLGVKEFSENGYREGAAETDILLKFPFVLEGFGRASRFLQYEESTGRMKLYHVKMAEGQKFRLGYLSPLTTVNECKDLCNEMMKYPSEVIVSYSCIFRKTFLSHCASWEMLPFDNCQICGAFLHGEIGHYNGKNEFLNGSNSMLIMAENQTKLPIDMKAFDKMYQIEDDKKDLYNYVLKKQSETIFKKNAELLNQILEQEESVRTNMFVDQYTGIENLTKYNYDHELKKYNKMCMISISKGQMFLAHFGEEKIGKIMRKTICDIINNIDNKEIKIYKHNACSFFLVADESFESADFLKISETLYLNFDKIVIPELDITFINNFAVVITGRNLLEKARYTSYEAETSNNRYKIYDNSNKETENISSTLRMVTVISEAVSKGRIIPYFQPIYDNRLKKFTKVEALMRIADKDGNIYYPNQFMDIAKDYKIYLEISKIMIFKVFDLFENREETVSLNISAYDVSEKSTREAIYRRLERMSPESRKHFVFEVLESEEYRDQSVLNDFIEEVRRYGARIAIDDFGSGYSNLLEIASLEPDFIKIDGQLIKDLTSDKRKQIIVDTIVFMAKQFQVELIAEMVETEEIQDIIVKKGISCTQGYYFAKPMDYEHLCSFLNPD